MEMKQVIDKIGTDYELLKSTLPDQIKQQAKGYVDPLLSAQNERISEALSNFEQQKAELEQNTAIIKRLESIKDYSQHGLKDYEVKQRADIIKAIRAISKGEDITFDTLDSFKKSFTTGNDPSGAVLIKPFFDNSILVLLQEYTDLRKYAATMSISTDTYIRIKSEDTTGITWDDDHTAPAETQPNKYAAETITVKNARANIIIPQNMLDDAFVDLDSEIIRQVARKFAYGEADAFFNGTGQGKPRGILTYPNGTTWDTWEQTVSGSASAILYPNLINFVYSLLSFYTKNAVFMANRTTLAQLRLITYGTNFPVPMWQPSLVAGQPSTLMGYPIVYAPSMPVFATNALAIAFGDFSAGYKIVDRMGMQLLKDPFTGYPNVKYRFCKRMGGGQEDYRAIKLMKIST